jgi:Ca2+-binding EF-hand superfamily protein
MTTMEEKKADVSEDELTKAFNELDDDGNGFITPREARKAYKQLAEKFNIPRVKMIIAVSRSGRDPTTLKFT